MVRWPLWSLFLLAAGCTCGAFDPNTTRFACTTDDDCGTGSVCAQVQGGLECVEAGAGGGMGGGSGGGAAGGGAGGGTECTSAVCADPPDRVQITSSIATMLRYECRGPFRVELRNAAGVRAAIRDTSVALAVSLPGVTVHNVASCTEAPLATLTIPTDQSFFEVYLKADGQAFGTATLTATAAQVATPGSAMVEVHPQPIDHLEFTSPPRTVTAGSCSTEEVTLEFRDAMNRRTDVDAPTTITMASAPGDLSNANIFFSDAACTTDGSLRQLQPGQGAAVFHVSARRAGSFTLTATPSTGAGSTQALTVLSAAPAKLAFINGPLVLSTTQSCSAGVFTVQLQDQFDNPVTAAADVRLRVSVTSLVGVTFFDATTNDCTTAAQTDFAIAAGSTSVSFRARGMTAVPSMGTIQAAAVSSMAIASASQVLRISSGFASRFVMTGAAQSPVAGTCSANPFTIELQDSAGNPSSSATAVTFTLTTTPATTDPNFGFYSGAGCQTDLGGTLTVPAGNSSAQFYFRGNRAVAAFEIRATSALTPPAIFLPGNSVRPAAPGKLVFAAPLTQVAQAGTCTAPYLVNVLDLFDNPTSFTTPQTVSVSSSPAGVTVGPSACTGSSVLLAPNTLQATFAAQHTIAGSYALTATASGFSTATPASMTVTAGTSTLVRDLPTGTANLQAGSCQQITLTRRDAFGNNAPTAGATPVTLTFPPTTTWAVYSSANCSSGMGAAINMNSTHTVTFSVSPRTAGNHQLVASISGPQSAAVDFQVSAGMPSLVFETPATGIGMATASQVAGACIPITLARKDVFSNDVPLGSAGNLTFTLPAGITVHTSTPCTGANAVASVPLTATDVRASFYVRATVSSGSPQTVVASLAGQSAMLALTVSPGPPTLQIVLPVGGAASLAANQCQPVTVERRDALGNLVPLATSGTLTVSPTTNLQVFSSIDCTGAPVTNIAVAAGTSSRSFSVRSQLANPVARLLSVALAGQTAPLSLTIVPGPTAQFVVLGLPPDMAAGSCVGPLTLRRRDLFSNDTSSGAIIVAVTSSQFSFSLASSCSGAGPGLMVGIADLSTTSPPFYATATAAGLATMTATLGAATGSANLTVF